MAAPGTPRPLGKNQRSILQALRDPRWHGQWFAGCGWIWNTVAQTEALMAGLEKRGLVSVERVPYPPRPTASGTYTTFAGTYRRVWTITEEGRRVSDLVIYNVRVSVVELVRATSPEDAYAQIAERLTAAGFEVYDRAEGIAGVFESDDQDDPLVADTRAR